ncbi:pre-mRNA-processing factor 17 [Homalodisca vitripennis]|nr:pre-mRNA-processing factor 17 [Homalodisca vitripennis]KAG8324516.1 pre-mRNA-processing factor 17 [Homalodisca vitripennis]
MSDGSFGQNKNHTMIRFLLVLCDNSLFKTITYYFPVRWHSFRPCDRTFGCIKRLIRKADRIYTPQEYIELILRASNSGRFTVHEVKTHEILNFKSWWHAYYYKAVSASDETAGRAIPKKGKE